MKNSLFEGRRIGKKKEVKENNSVLLKFSSSGQISKAQHEMNQDMCSNISERVISSEEKGGRREGEGKKEGQRRKGEGRTGRGGWKREEGVHLRLLQ